VLDIERRVRCRGSGVRDGAIVSIKWAKTELDPENETVG
jgi:hypothetical protein